MNAKAQIIAEFAAVEYENSLEGRIAELLEAMKENGLEWVMDWMRFSNQMLDKLNSCKTLEEYDDWRVSLGKISTIRTMKRKGRDQMIEILTQQEQVDVIAFDRYTDWCVK